MSSSDAPVHSPGHSELPEALLTLLRHREFWAGKLMIAFGLLMAIHGPSYSLGTLMHMGPGFLPTSLGVILIALGIGIAAPAYPPVIVALFHVLGITHPHADAVRARAGAAALPGEHEHGGILPEHPQWFAWACILASPLAFINFGTLGGLATGTATCVFVAALGDRDATWKASFLLSVGLALAGVTLFARVLQIPMPVFRSLNIAVGSVFIAVVGVAYIVFTMNALRAALSLALAIALAVVFEFGLFFARPVPAIFITILCGLLGYLSFRNIRGETLTSVMMEYVPIFFVVAHLFWLLFYLLVTQAGVSAAILMNGSGRVGCSAALSGIVVLVLFLLRRFNVLPRAPLIPLTAGQMIGVFTALAAVEGYEYAYFLDALSGFKGMNL